MVDMVTIMGGHNHLGYIVAYGYSARKLIWGDGDTLRSPADAGRLLELPRPARAVFGRVLRCAMLFCALLLSRLCPLAPLLQSFLWAPRGF